MLKRVMTAAAFVGGLFALAAPASAMPVNTGIGGQAGSAVTQVAWYCNPYGSCIRTPRAGYVWRSAPYYAAPAYRAPVYRAPGYRAPTYTSRTVRTNGNRTVVKRTTVRPNGNVTVRKRVVR